MKRAVVVLMALALAIALPAQVYNPSPGEKGPPSSTSGNLASFNDTTGQVLEDSGLARANVVLASSPGAGVAHFAGSTQTVTSSAVAGSDMTAHTVTATQLAAQYAILRCQTGLGDGVNAMAAATYLQTFCYNDSGVTWTITRIGCFTDNAGTSTLAATNGAGTALLTGPVTCTAAAGGAAGTQSATTTIANGDVIKFSFAADGTSKQTSWFVSLTQ